MQIAVLGPVSVQVGGTPVDLGTPRQRTILAVLARANGRTVPVDAVIDQVWGDRAPAGALSTLHGYIAALRRALEPDRPPRAAPTVLVTEAGGYALRVAPGQTDAGRLEQAVTEARNLLRVVPDHLRPNVVDSGTDAVRLAVSRLDEALLLWRGEPFPELGDDPAVLTDRARLTDLRMAAQELRVVALLALGRHDEVLAPLGAMTTAHPLHEHWWSLHAVALARSARQADALAVLQTLRSLLADELGVDPSAQVRDLQTALLHQDPSVGWTPPVSASPTDVRDVTAAVRRPRYRESPPLPRWSLAGRHVEADRLVAMLERALTGHPQAGLVTGERGVGKSRLVLEAAGRAFELGYVVTVGQCTLDGPPPLWPWRQALASLIQQTGVESQVLDLLDTSSSDDFATWDQVAREICRIAAVGPVLIVLEDVQWADAATARVLSHLLLVARHEPLAVVVSMRVDARTETELDLTAALARHEGARIDLVGLGLEDSATLVTEVSGGEPGTDLRSLWERSAGNPFFLCELALARGTLSGSLSDVVLSRVRSLPKATIEALEAASVIDVVFDLDLLALVLGDGHDEARDRLWPAIAAGLVSDGGRVRADFRFSHGVVREVVNENLSHSTRARWHRQVARSLEQFLDLGRVELRSALVHHWELAGYAWVGEAWRSTLVAAAVARSRAAYDEETKLLVRVLTWLQADVGSTAQDRFEVLMMLTDAARWSADWQAVSDAVDEAVEVAERLGSPELAARAAVSTMEGALWHVRPFGTVHVPIIEALERTVHGLPPEQSDLRCRALLALAMELYYGGDVTRIDALVAEALLLAESSDDPAVQTAAYLGAFAARSRPDTAEDREVYADRARQASRTWGDPRFQLLAETLAVSLASELGRADVVRRDLPRLLQLTRTRGLATAEAVLRVVHIPWLVMSGADEEAAESMDRLDELSATLRMPNLIDAAGATRFAASVLAGDPERLVDLLAPFLDQSVVPASPMAVVVLLRAGQADLARTVHEGQVDDLSSHTFMTLMNACLTCEVAAGLHDRDLAAVAYAAALPYAGRMCSAGSAAPFGPVDGFLALAARVLGDHESATTHAAAAEALAVDWQLPRVTQELARSWDRYRI